MATFADLSGGDLDTELGSNDTQILFLGTKRRHAVNEGMRQFADLTECLVKSSTVAVSSMAQEFNLLSTAILPGGDFLRMSDRGPVYQTFDSNGSLQQTIVGEDFPQREIQWLDAVENGWRSTTAGAPTAWYLKPNGGQLLFGLDRPSDVSTTSSNTAQLTIPYLPKASSMTASTDVPFTLSSQTRTDLQPYHQATVHYAAHLMEKLRKDKDASDQQLTAFLGYVQRYLQATRPKGPRGVRAGQSYFRNARNGRGVGYGSPVAPWWR